MAVKPELLIGVIINMSAGLLDTEKHEFKAGSLVLLGCVQDSYSFDWNLFFDGDADKTLVDFYTYR